MMLRSEAVHEPALKAAFDACTEAVSTKEKLMNNAAFIVYYEERRYGDLRLEPQTPGRRAVQNGFRAEALRALADEKLEIDYLIKAGDNESTDDLLGYSATARKAIKSFVDTLAKAS